MSFMGVSMDNILLYHKLNSNLQKINLQHINENKEQMQNEDIDTNSLQLKTLNRVNTTRSVEQKKIKNSKGNPSIRIMETKLKTMNYASQKKNIQQIIEEIKKLEQVSQSKKKLQIKTSILFSFISTPTLSQTHLFLSFLIFFHQLLTLVYCISF